MDHDHTTRVNKPNKLHSFNKRPCGHNVGRGRISIKFLKLWKWLTEPSPLSLLFLAWRTSVVQEPELGTTGPDVLCVALELKLIKIIIFTDFFLFIIKRMHFTAEKMPVTSITSTSEHYKQTWNTKQHEKCLFWALGSLWKISMPWATRHLIISKRFPTLSVQVSRDLVFYIVSP